MLGLEFKLGLFKTKMAFVFEISHYFSFALFNLSLLGGESLTAIENPELRGAFDYVSKIIFFAAILFNILRSLAFIYDSQMPKKQSEDKIKF